MTEIRQATVQDAITIQQLAETTWWPVYEPIVGAEQVQYMLDAFYDTDTITTQINKRTQTYLLLLEDQVPLGFAAYSPRQENSEVYKLHKLYCLPAEQGKGYGKLLIQAVEEAVIAAGKNTLELNVNRHNKAKTFYEKQGYRVIYEEDIPIGDGYEMNDYVMQKQLS